MQLRSYLLGKTRRSRTLRLHLAVFVVLAQPISFAESNVIKAFVDDFSRPDLTRYYDVRPGAGSILRGNGRLHYQIERAANGASITGDFLGIDRLGRPVVPSTLASLTFSGTEWVLDTSVIYHLGKIGNGRSASIWLSLQGPDYRDRKAIKIVRSADLSPSSHSLTAFVIENGKQVVSHSLATADQLARSGEDAWVIRVSRRGRRFEVNVGSGNNNLQSVLTWSFDEEAGDSFQSLVVGGAAFSNGASFDVKSIKLTGASPVGVTDRPQVYFKTGVSVSRMIDVSSADVLQALSAGRDVYLRMVRISGELDFRSLGQKHSGAPTEVAGRWTCEYCLFEGTFLVGNPLTFQSEVSFFRSIFADVAVPGATFTKFFSCVGCEFRKDTRFIGTQFLGGADFSYSVFDQRTFFRIARFGHDVSFYGATFRQGADLSSTTFDGNVSLSNLEFQEGRLTFYGSKLGGAVRIVENLEGEAQLKGQELNFDRTKLTELIFSAGDRQDPGEQTGPSLTDVDAPVSFRQAHIGRVEIFRTRFNKRTDFSGVQLGAVKLDGSEFSDLKLDWPVGKVDAPDDTFDSIVRSYKDRGDITNERLARWDSHVQNAQRGITANDTCLSCWITLGICRLVWTTTEYFTSLQRQFWTGLILILVFATIVYAYSIFGRTIVRIAKPIEIKLRPAETPTLSHGERYLRTSYQPGYRGQIKRLWYCTLFSLMTFAKFGVGNLRVNPAERSKIFVSLVWIEWFLGYAWYSGILYTITGKLPFFGGLG